jgi:hypothetical protein
LTDNVTIATFILDEGRNLIIKRRALSNNWVQFVGSKQKNNKNGEGRCSLDSFSLFLKKKKIALAYTLLLSAHTLLE